MENILLVLILHNLVKIEINMFRLSYFFKRLRYRQKKKQDSYTDTVFNFYTFC